MKILKLLNKKNLSIIIISLLLSFSSIAEEKPVDIWNIDKQEEETASEEIISIEKTEEISKSNIYKTQTDKNKNSIKLDEDLSSKTIKIAGLYDPQDYGLSISMWSNSDGSKLKKLFKNIDKYNLSKDASEILNISLLTNAYYPNQNITVDEFLKFKTNWLIKDSNLELIEEYLIKNQNITILSKTIFVLAVTAPLVSAFPPLGYDLEETSYIVVSYSFSVIEVPN